MKYKISKWWWVLIIILVIAGIITFAFPISYSKTEYYTETEKYEIQVSYQEPINRDNCDSSSGCVCTKHGGFLWLTCVQCSCTRYKMEVRERLVLKERTNNDKTTLFKSWTNSVISESEAKSIAQGLLDFMTKKGRESYSISVASKDKDIWKVIATGIRDDIIVEINSNNGKINYIDYNGVKISINNIMQNMK